MAAEHAPSTHTHFFRDETQLLAIVKSLPAFTSSGEVARLWSAGCSTGAEPYSLAILCAEQNVNVEITATDFADEALAIGRAARYSEHALRHVSAERRTRFFSADGDGFVLSREVRDRVRFASGDLCEPASIEPLAASFNVIVCRNVLIYYDAEEAARLLRALALRLAPRGVIFLGASDHFTFRDEDVPLRQTEIGDAFAYVHAAEFKPRAQFTSRIEVPSVVPAPVRRSAEPPVSEQIATRIDRAFSNITQHAFDDAARALDEATQLDPTAPEPHYYLGLLRRKQGRHRDAVEALRRAHLLAPAFWPASFLLAGAWDRLGRRDQAAQARAHVVSILRQNADVRTFRVANGDPLFDARAVLAACEPVR